MSTCCAAVKQAFCLQAIEISDEEVNDGPEVQQQGRKRQRVVSMCQCNIAASCTFAQRVLLLQADDPYNLNCHGDCSEQLFGGKSIADCTLHPCTSLRECVTQAWFCQPCSEKLKDTVTGYVTCAPCKVSQSLFVIMLFMFQMLHLTHDVISDCRLLP